MSLKMANFRWLPSFLPPKQGLFIFPPRADYLDSRMKCFPEGYQRIYLLYGSRGLVLENMTKTYLQHFAASLEVAEVISGSEYFKNWEAFFTL